MQNQVVGAVCVCVCACVCVMGGTLEYTALYSKLTILGPTLTLVHTTGVRARGLVRVALNTVGLARNTSSQSIDFACLIHS